MADPAYSKPLKELYDEISEDGQLGIDNTVRLIRRNLGFCYLFLFIATLAPVLSLNFVPSSESIETWFQRSGAVIVVFGLFAELKASKIRQLSCTDTKPFLYDSIYLKRKYSSLALLTDTFCAIAIVAGTIVWGYGDFIWKLTCT